MVFASNLFIISFAAILPIYMLLVGKFSVNARYLLIFLSLAFYTYWLPPYLFVLLGSIAFNYTIARLILVDQSETSRKLKMWLAAFANLSMLAYFKYYNFFFQEILSVFGPEFEISKLALPLGISFFTFQQIAFIADVYGRKVNKINLLDYSLFISFFPQLIAGPIVNHAEMLPQLDRKKNWQIRADHFAIGFFIFSIGLFKKSFLIDPYTPFLDIIFDAANNGSAIDFVDGWTAAIGYSFQIYFDFSGYSDMAIGLALIFGLKLPINFFSPYKAASVREFWQRWHITLSRMLQRFLYIPFGGSRNGTLRTIIALIGTMIIGGLWHGAGWQFIIWGVLHGVFLCVNHLWSKIKNQHVFLSILCRKRFWKMVMVLVTFLALAFSWVFFRAENIGAAWLIVEGMLGVNGIGDLSKLNRGIAPAFPIYFIIIWALPNTMQVFGRFPVALIPDRFSSQISRTSSLPFLRFRMAPFSAVVTIIIFLMGWFSLSNLSPFIYFQF